MRSPNHRKNVQQLSDRGTDSGTAKKRKNDDSDEESRKRSRAVTQASETPPEETERIQEIDRPKKKAKSVTFAQDILKVQDVAVEEAEVMPTAEGQITSEERLPAPAAIDEAEWAAFERDVAPLAQGSTANTQYSATIVAAPVSAADIAAQETSRKLTKEVEADEEKEDDERRLEEELDVMEEMEERVKRLREKREALRKAVIEPPVKGQTGQSETTTTVDTQSSANADTNGISDESDYEDFDDWGFR